MLRAITTAAAVAVAVIGVAFAAVATTAALYWPKAVMVEALQPVVVLGATFCTGQETKREKERE